MNDINYETKEAAIEAGKKDAECIDRGCFFVGQAIPINDEFLIDRTRLFDVEQFNEDMSEQAGGEDYYIDEKDNAKQLEELNKLIADFILSKCDTTMSFTIEDCEEIII